MMVSRSGSGFFLFHSFINCSILSYSHPQLLKKFKSTNKLRFFPSFNPWSSSLMQGGKYASGTAVVGPSKVRSCLRVIFCSSFVGAASNAATKSLRASLGCTCVSSKKEEVTTTLSGCAWCRSNVSMFSGVMGMLTSPDFSLSE